MLKFEKENVGVSCCRSSRTVLLFDILQQCDTSHSDTLEGSEIKNFYNLLTHRQEVDVIYGKYAHTNGQMSSSDLLNFLQNEQREPVSLDYAHKLIDTFEVDEIGNGT